MRARTAAFVALGVARVLAGPSEVRAQVVVLDDAGVPEAAARRWRERFEAAHGREDLEGWVRAREPVATVPRERLVVLSQIEQLLVGARHARSRFRERDARALLAEAEGLAAASLDVPGTAAWYAEVQLAIAITAAQIGLPTVSEAALRRAASVDSSRAVQAAEAHPEVVARARAIARAAATGPRGRFEVRAGAEGAFGYRDDAPIGALPATGEAPVGPHVLRVDAPGHLAWASVITVFEGDRPPVEVALSPSPALTAARAATRAARAGDLDALVAALGALPEGPVVHRVRPGGGALDRALVTTCRASGCRGPLRLEGALDPGAPLASSDAEGLRWLAERPAVVVDAVEWWEEWSVWLAAAAVIGAGVAAAIALAVGEQGEGPPPLVLIVDPGGLPVGGVD